MRLVFDIETDHYSIVRVQNIWCVVAQDLDTGEIYKFRNAKAAVELLKKADLLVAHNGVMYDLPVLQRLAGFAMEQWPKVLDTLILSRLFYNNIRDKHSLDSWGKDLGNYKGDFKDFSGFSQEMLDYCIQDVNVTGGVYRRMKQDWDLPAYKQSIVLEHEFAKILSQQVLNGFRLDEPFANKLIEDFQAEINILEDELISLMPKVPDLTSFRVASKEGRLISETETGYWYKTPKGQYERYKELKYEEPNPYSRQQIIDLFVKKYAWEPKQLTDKGNPMIDEGILDELSYEEAKKFSRLFRLNKQKSMIKSKEEDGGGWIDHMVNGRVHGNVNTNAAVTGRATHSRPNLAQVDKKNLDMRRCWVAKEGWDLVSVDADALEFRLLAAELYRYDQGSLTEAVESGKKEEGTDVHTRNQRAVQLNKRDSAKGIIYALIYGAGNKKLGTLFAEDQGMTNVPERKLMNIGLQVRQRLMDSMEGMAELIQEDIKRLDGGPLWSRSEHSKLNTRIQSAGAIVMKQGLVNFWKMAKDKGYKHGIDWGLTANVHDEIVFEVRPEISEELNKLCVIGIEMTTEQFKLHCPIRAQGQIGKNWGEIH